MKYIKSIYKTALLMLIVSSVLFAQEKEMMKTDSMETVMMKNGMKTDMKSGKMMNDGVKDNERMHGGMIMKINKNNNGLAIKGYDPVGYFTDGKAEMGDKMYSYKWMGAEWHFINIDHLNMFKQNPEKYAPQYGGFCAYGVSKKALFETDPMVWKIVDGRLYLNKNAEVGRLFNENVKESIMNGEMNWPKLNTNEKSN